MPEKDTEHITIDQDVVYQNFGNWRHIFKRPTFNARTLYYINYYIYVYSSKGHSAERSTVISNDQRLFFPLAFVQQTHSGRDAGLRCVRAQRLTAENNVGFAARIPVSVHLVAGVEQGEEERKAEGEREEFNPMNRWKLI